MSEPRYPYVAVDVAEDEADEAGALLFELGAGGVEQRDATTLKRGAAGKVTLVASFERDVDAHAAAGELPAGWSPRVEEVVGDAWRDEWKKHFEPFRVCPGVVVCPPWRTVEAGPGEKVVVLEPGRAFGTGLHETTSLVAEVLASTRLEGLTVLDVGCGSGILALVALELGAARARAIDVDPDAVAVTRENAERNGLGQRVDADEAPVEALRESYPLVLANIESRTLLTLAPALAARVAPGGRLVLSGILADDVAPSQIEDVRRAYAALEEEEVRRRGEWIAVVMRRPR
ncbi:MAG TPA: 50S ribosomal protein L11 methyltransferase [Polyangiaceae bacterium]|jgi:ribosomal protein L11 methyltransferase